MFFFFLSSYLPSLRISFVDKIVIGAKDLGLKGLILSFGSCLGFVNNDSCSVDRCFLPTVSDCRVRIVLDSNLVRVWVYPSIYLH